MYLEYILGVYTVSIYWEYILGVYAGSIYWENVLGLYRLAMLALPPAQTCVQSVPNMCKSCTKPVYNLYHEAQRPILTSESAPYQTCVFSVPFVPNLCIFCTKQVDPYRACPEDETQ